MQKPAQPDADPHHLRWPAASVLRGSAIVPRRRRGYVGAWVHKEVFAWSCFGYAY
jgi:hypothetical protein